MKKERIIEVLKEKGYEIISEKRAVNNYGDVLRLSNGCIVNCYDSGKFNCQGKNTEEIKQLLDSANIDARSDRKNRKVFVVYGHDSVAKTQLEAMLRRWELEPLIIDQLETAGNTIIEKLEEYISQAHYGIVLATPDDIGYPKDKEDSKKYRVRQNVVLEMGMLLAKFGRKNVAILLKNTEDMEKPSDIHGLIYIPFKDNVEDTALSLAKELNGKGYNIRISQL